MSENIQDIDLTRLHELMDEYQSTTERQRQREIENKVLAETVWKTRNHEHRISDADLQRLLESVDEDDKIANRILRSIFIESL